MKNEKTCQQCGSTNTKTLGKGYNAVRWCRDCSFEEHTPQMVQAECDACDQVLTLDESPIGLTLCIECGKEYDTDLDTLNLCEWAEPDWSFSDDLLTEAEIVHDYHADPKV